MTRTKEIELILIALEIRERRIIKDMGKTRNFVAVPSSVMDDLSRELDEIDKDCKAYRSEILEIQLG
jgi:hypothetical protein